MTYTNSQLASHYANFKLRLASKEDFGRIEKLVNRIENWEVGIHDYFSSTGKIPRGLFHNPQDSKLILTALRGGDLQYFGKAPNPLKEKPKNPKLYNLTKVKIEIGRSPVINYRGQKIRLD